MDLNDFAQVLAAAIQAGRGPPEPPKNLTFSGRRIENAPEFLLALNDFKNYKGLTDEALLNTMPLVLKDRALSWHRQFALQLAGLAWHEFQNVFRSHFFRTNKKKIAC